MAKAHEDVNGVLGFKHHAVLKRDAHAAAYPVTGLEAASAVMDDLVGKNDKRFMASFLDLLEISMGNIGPKDRPLLNQAERLKRRMLVEEIF